jgi:DMSO/TMAO reductase YedYZ molybdopterin-dependent catalytic subunit
MRRGSTAPPRRRFLQVAGSGALALSAGDSWAVRLLAQAVACGDDARGELIRTLPLYGVGATEVPFGQVLGRGLDARRYTDLSGLTASTLVTPLDDVFLRTTAPPELPAAGAWTVTLQDLEGATLATVPVTQLAADATPQGTHVLECAGNSNPWNFGLMSAATFAGVPLAAVLARAPRPAAATGLLVTGYDHAAADTRQSLPGASWILPLGVLSGDRPSAASGGIGAAPSGAAPFLATRMNDAPLTRDHGAPVRLAVPGWYGCAWIKWVHTLQWIGADARSTTQMLEFAFRTDQDGIPMRAADYAPPVIDTAAMPVRVEQRRVDGRTEYRIVGVTWGGASPADRLLIRFGSRDTGQPVQVCPAASSSDRAWSLWTHRWRPDEPGYYDITLKAADPAVRTRRLDVSFYIRRVRIDEV